VKSHAIEASQSATVANQRYPSAVCAMARTESFGSPFEVVQTSWPNCVRAAWIEAPGRDRQQAYYQQAGRAQSHNAYIGHAGPNLLSIARLYFTRGAMLPLVAAARQIAVF